MEDSFASLVLARSEELAKPIHDGIAACGQAFEDLLNVLDGKADEARLGLPPSRIRDEYHRFKVWTGTTEASLKVPFEIMNLRLGLNDCFKLVTENLNDLKVSLNDMSATVEGTRPNRVAARNTDKRSLFYDKGYLTAPWKKKPATITEIEVLFEFFVDSVTELEELSRLMDRVLGRFGGPTGSAVEGGSMEDACSDTKAGKSPLLERWLGPATSRRRRFFYNYGRSKEKINGASHEAGSIMDP